MPLSGIRLVIDTNTLLRGLAKRGSSSGRIVSAAEQRKLLLLTSNRVVEEYRIILSDPVIRKRFPALTPQSVEASIRSLVYLSENFGSVRTSFNFPRDRKDEKFLNLAIAGRATHLVTFDNDLLSLATSRDDSAKRLRHRIPRLIIQMPGEFLSEHGRHLMT